MTTQIDNLVTSFNEILLQTGNLLDELYTDKSSNLILPNNKRSTTVLNQAIKQFDRNLDDVAIQLNDISQFQKRLDQRVVEREEAAKLKQEQLAQQLSSQTPQHLSQQQQAQAQAQAQADQQQSQQQQQVQSQTQGQAQTEQSQDQYSQAVTFDNLQLGNDDFNDGENILNDISEFLSTVPDTAIDTNGNSGDFNDNIQQLLMESNSYANTNSNDQYNTNNDDNLISNFNINNSDVNYNNDNNNNSINLNNFNSNNELNSFQNNSNDPNALINTNDDSNLDIDNNFFNEIDSMLNI